MPPRTCVNRLSPKDYFAGRISDRYRDTFLVNIDPDIFLLVIRAFLLWSGCVKHSNPAPQGASLMLLGVPYAEEVPDFTLMPPQDYSYSII